MNLASSLCSTIHKVCSAATISKDISVASKCPMHEKVQHTSCFTLHSHCCALEQHLQPATQDLLTYTSMSASKQASNSC